MNANVEQSRILLGMRSNLTCKVCSQIFDDPHETECRHTFCKNCIFSNVEDDKVVCPECNTACQKSAILPDQKMQSFVEMYFQEQKRPDSRFHVDPEKPDICVMCNEYMSVYFCFRCKMFLCRRCRRIHLKLFNCYSKESYKIPTIHNDFKRRVEETKTALSKLFQLAESSKDTSIAYLANDREQVSLKLAQFREEVMQQVDQFMKEEWERAMVAIRTERDDMENRFDTLSQQFKETVTHLEHLQDAKSVYTIMHYPAVRRSALDLMDQLKDSMHTKELFVQETDPRVEPMLLPKLKIGYIKKKKPAVSERPFEALEPLMPSACGETNSDESIMDD